MSNIYIQEPPTNGKILLHTTVGDIDIELWSKEAPKACRNFVQLCMEGYYDGVIFHRVVKDFIVQGGDPTGTGEGGESIYGHPFKDEFHSRLRCNRRGLVAMANSGPHDNGSQFFFTLGPAPELNNKHTIFGKVAGNTIYNMIKLAECEIGADERPLYPCKINKTEILANPYNDIIPRENKRAKKDDKDDKKSKSKSKATKNFSLLSFGEEAEEDEEEVNKAIKDIRVKSKSSHDLADDPNLSSVPVMATEPREPLKRPASEMENNDDDKTTESETEKKAKVETIKKKLKKDPDEKSLKKEKTDKTTPPSPPATTTTATPPTLPQSEVKKEEGAEETKLSRSEELREEANKLKKEIKESRKKSEPAVKEAEGEKVEDVPQNDAIATYRKERQKYKDLRKEQKKKGSGREELTLSILKDFQAKLNAARTLASGYSDDEAEGKKEEEEKKSEDEDDDDVSADISWMRHKLHFDDKHIKVLDANITDVDRYEIQDPRNPITKRRREASKQTMKEKR